MREAPYCPICEEAALAVEFNELSGTYTADCPACGIGLTHPEWEGINAVEAYFENEGGTGTCENWDNEGEERVWRCSSCDDKRVLGEGEPPYRFCPDCGREVA